MLEIRHYPDPVLFKKAREITMEEIKSGQLSDGTKLAALVEEMLSLEHSHGGIGLAAPQVGVGIRLFVFDNTDGTKVVVVNPKITPEGVEKRSQVEGCLSVPFAKGKIERPAKISVKYVDYLTGEQKEMMAEGLTASVIQHENDHLDGLLFVDRLSSSARFMQRKVLKKLEQAYEFHQERQRQERQRIKNAGNVK